MTGRRKRTKRMEYRRVESFGAANESSRRFAESLRAVATTPESGWIVAGDREIRRLDFDGRILKGWPTARSAWSIAVDPEGRIWAGEPGQVEIFDPDGKVVDVWQDADLFGLITGLEIGEETLVADAQTRWIHRFGADRRLLNHIGDQHRKGGFHIPNGVLDFGVDRDGTVVVANPGMHRVERYGRDGTLLGRFGQFGQHDPARFPGCCNPTNLAVGPRGEIAVSEKSGPRVKVYNDAGELLAVVADGDDFDPAAKNLDLAVADDGRIGVVDTVALELVIFAPAAAIDEADPSRGATR